MRVCNFITKYMGVLVLLMAALTLFVPQTLNWAPLTWLAPLLGIALFGMGLTLNPQDFKVVFTRPKDILIGTVAQFVIMPGTAWLLTEIFSLPIRHSHWSNPRRLLSRRNGIKRNDLSCQRRSSLICCDYLYIDITCTNTHTSSYLVVGG